MQIVPVEITIRDNKTGAYVTIPVVPAALEYRDGEAQAETIHILNLGEVDFLTGVALDMLGWSSFFPARYDPGYCNVADLLPPTIYRNRLSGWKDGKTPLQVVCPAAGINKTMYVKTFEWKLQGAEGDIYYQVSFREVKVVVPKQLDPGIPIAPPKGKQTPPARSAAPAAPKAKTTTANGTENLLALVKREGIAGGAQAVAIAAQQTPSIIKVAPKPWTVLPKGAILQLKRLEQAIKDAEAFGGGGGGAR